MNQPADTGDHQQHHQRQLVDLQRVIGSKGAREDPGEVRASPGNLRWTQDCEFPQ